MPLLSLAIIANELGADSAAVMLPDDAEQVLVCYDSYNMPPEWTAIRNSYDKETPGGNVEVYRTGEPATSNHLRTTLEGFFIESVMIVPVKRDEKTIATLELIHDKDDKTFSEEDRNAAEIFAKKLESRLPAPF